MVERSRERRDALHTAAKDVSLSAEERQELARALEKLPRDSSPSPFRKRDQIDGRPRGMRHLFA